MNTLWYTIKNEAAKNIDISSLSKIKRKVLVFIPAMQCPDFRTALCDCSAVSNSSDC
jgi:hypothetical protein